MRRAVRVAPPPAPTGPVVVTVRPYMQPLPMDLSGYGYLTDDAPMGTGQVYGRVNGLWTPVVPLTGGTMLGRLVLARDPQEDHEAATKRYADSVPFRADGGEY